MTSFAPSPCAFESGLSFALKSSEKTPFEILNGSNMLILHWKYNPDSHALNMRPNELWLILYLKLYLTDLSYDFRRRTGKKENR
jgi:hypothetical protein